MTKVDDGMTFDADCLDRLLENEDMFCSAWPWDFDPGLCRVLARERALGEPCEGHPHIYPARAEDCAEGLYCFNGACVDEYAFELEVGEPCEFDFAQPCVTSAYCGADGVCHPRAPLGEPCTDHYGCESSLYCAGLHAQGLGTCVEHLAKGEICDPRDRSPCAPTVEFPWPGCVPAEDSEYRCADEEPGICHMTFMAHHP